MFLPDLPQGIPASCLLFMAHSVPGSILTRKSKCTPSNCPKSQQWGKTSPQSICGLNMYMLCDYIYILCFCVDVYILFIHVLCVYVHHSTYGLWCVYMYLVCIYVVCVCYGVLIRVLCGSETSFSPLSLSTNMSCFCQVKPKNWCVISPTGPRVDLVQLQFHPKTWILFFALIWY